MTALAARLGGRIGHLIQRQRSSPASGYRPAEACLFAPRSPHLSRLAAIEQIGLTGFATYARLARSGRLSPQLAASVVGADRDASLQWYLTAYGPAALPCRVPLSASDIAYLLTPDPLLALAGGVPRIVAWEALRPHSRAPWKTGEGLDLVYWWACERAPHLGVEDCLVPAAYVAALQSKDATPRYATVFERLLADRDADLHALLALGPPRLVIEGYLSFLAIEQPGLLAFVPRVSSPDHFTELLHFAGLNRSGAGQILCDAVQGSAQRAGYDPAGLAYRSVGPEGHRAFVYRTEVPRPAAPALTTFKADVEIVGPLSLSSGLGQAARLSVAAFERAGLKVARTDFAHGFPSPRALGGEDPRPRLSGPAGATVFHLNPDMLPLAFAFGPGNYARRRAGYFFWELDAPATCDFLAFDLVDTIWTATDFVRSVYAPAFLGPVECVGLALPELPPVEPGARAALRHRLGLAADSFVCLSVFDALSYSARKNPAGTVRAFQAAFPGRTDVALVLKVHNRPQPGGEDAEGGAWRKLEAALASDPRIRLIDETMTHGEVLALIAGADLFVSLHRSEGFGLGPAEAMQIGTPVAVTAYGGTEDFCDDRTAFRVPYVLKAVGADDYAHAEPGRVWADPDIGAAAQHLRQAAENRDLGAAQAREAKRRITMEFGLASIARRYAAALERLLARP